MSSNILYEQSLVDTLRDQCNKAQSRIWVASPYVGSKNDVLKILGDQWKKSIIDCRILTDADAGIFGSDSFEAFKEAKVSIRTLLSLHAKIYIVDDWCMISSANLTGKAFSRRYEVGVVCLDQIKELEKLFEEWWQKSTEISALPKVEFHDHKKYETELNQNYSRKAKLPDPPTSKFEPFQRGNLDDMLEWYLNTWDKYHPKGSSDWESYKWNAFKQAEQDFSHGVIDIAELLKDEGCFSLCGNLLAGNNFYPREMLKKMSGDYKKTIEIFLAELYDENRPLKERIEDFMRKTKELTEEIKQKTPEVFNSEQPQSKQDLRAISVYLALRYPEKHFLYKYDMYTTFLKKTKIAADKLPYRSKDKLEIYENFCRKLREEIKNHKALMAKCIETYGDNKFNLNLLTQDFMYCMARYTNNMELEVLTKG